MSILYQSQAMLTVIEQARRFARSSASVLIAGESGTGKELLARLIHEVSPRRAEPLVRVNCSSLSEGLFESEFFGHERGAFTGAVAERPGRIEAAGRGTLFLDEVGELSPRLQPKLLRVLEEAEFERVGSQKSRSVQARIVAATNRPLHEEVAGRSTVCSRCEDGSIHDGSLAVEGVRTNPAGGFRLDLYHRLNVLPLVVPPLRQRREDIPLLVQHFIGQFREDSAVRVVGLTARAMRAMCDFDWPGNIRQLRNVVHRACVLATTETIDVDGLSLRDESPVESSAESLDLPPALLKLPLREIERRVILQGIQQHGGNKTAAARALGVTPRTLRNKMIEYRRLGHAG